MSELINHELGDDGVAIMGLNRAPVNALNPHFLGEIKNHIEELMGFNMTIRNNLLELLKRIRKNMFIPNEPKY